MDVVSSDSEFSNTPPDIVEAAKNVSLNLLPEKSKTKYENEYILFINWCQSQKIKKYSENVLLTYFGQKAQTLKSSTLWSKYSMLRQTLKIKNDIDISHYAKLIAFLKKKSVGYKAKKSLTLSKDHIENFIRNAPDDEYLCKKVCFLILFKMYNISRSVFTLVFGL